MLALGVQLNMLNFAAVPITIGIGADYVVNLLGAMDAFKRQCAAGLCAHGRGDLPVFSHHGGGLRVALGGAVRGAALVWLGRGTRVR